MKRGGALKLERMEAENAELKAQLAELREAAKRYLFAVANYTFADDDFIPDLDKAETALRALTKG